MRAKNWSIGVGLGFVLGLACNKPDSVELGGACKDTVECKDPSDTCMVFGQKQVCTMTCTKDDRCPDAYACVRLDTTVQRNGETSKGGIAGYCIDRVDVPARAATVY